MILQVTLTIAAAAALLNFWLALRIGAIRRAHSISVGDGGNEALTRRMRAQANFIEFTPIILILIALIDLSGKGAPWLGWVGGSYIIGRILHALGMDGEPFQIGRMIGTIISLLVLLGLSVVAVLISLGYM